MEEEWRDIPEYLGLYQVSNLGHIRSLDHFSNNRLVKGRLLKERKTGSDGRIQVALYRNGKQKQYYVSRLVAEVFIPNPLHCSEVNHIDENIENNRIDNLEWCSAKYNANYGTRTKRLTETNYKSNTYYNNGNRLKKPIIQFDLNDNIINQYDSALEAAIINNYNNCMIGRCANGKIETYKGYKWRFA